MVNHIVVYASPGSCSKVPMILLEEIGEPYDVELVRFMRGAHKSSAYRALNPKGKVPTLVVNGVPMTENPVIITFLNDNFPLARLLPQGNAFVRYQQLSDLCFCSSTLHPIVTRIRMPQFYAQAESIPLVWKKGCESMDEYFLLIESRLHDNEWWYGAQWSAVDAYLFWVFWRVEGAGYDVSRFPAFSDHFARMARRPSVQAVIDKESEMEATLREEGLVFEPPNVN